MAAVLSALQPLVTEAGKVVYQALRPRVIRELDVAVLCEVLFEQHTYKLCFLNNPSHGNSPYYPSLNSSNCLNQPSSLCNQVVTVLRVELLEAHSSTSNNPSNPDNPNPLNYSPLSSPTQNPNTLQKASLTSTVDASDHPNHSNHPNHHDNTNADVPSGGVLFIPGKKG